MVLARAPVRIGLAGGGSDLPSYYSQREEGGWLVSAAINQYIYVGVSKRADNLTKISAGPTSGEVVSSIEDASDDIIRQCLIFKGITGGVDVVSFSDIPAKCGLGTSGAFTVALLSALSSYKGEPKIHPLQLAIDAGHIEMELLGLPVGMHDQTVSAYGGIIEIKISQDGSLDVHDYPILPRALEELNQRLFIFFTGKTRSSGKVLEEQSKRQEEGSLEPMDEIIKIGKCFLAACCNRDWPRAGRLLHRHWEYKKQLSSQVTDPQIDDWYEMGLSYGALGGKILGAGGGGHLLFLHNGDSSAMVEKLQEAGLTHVPFTFEHSGAKVVYHD